MPRSAPEAAAKLRGGLAECALFIAGAPVAAFVAAARLRGPWIRLGRFLRSDSVKTAGLLLDWILRIAAAVATIAGAVGIAL